MNQRIVFLIVLMACGILSAQALEVELNPSTSPSTMRDATPATFPSALVNPSTQPSAVARVATQPSTLASAASRPSTRPARLETTSRSGRRSRYERGRERSATTRENEADLVPAPGAMASDFDILATRNIFIKGRQITRDGDSSEDSVAATPASAPESKLVFNGVTITDDRVVAFIEDTTIGKVMIVQAGDSVANGKISDITLDYLDYESDGKLFRVAIGQNLLGGDPVPTTQPDAGASSGASAPGTDSMLERLRRRRLDESRGK